MVQDDENIVGVMMESYLYDGKQSDTIPADQIVHGKSLTDSCLGREKTEQLVVDRHQGLVSKTILEAVA